MISDLLRAMKPSSKIALKSKEPETRLVESNKNERSNEAKSHLTSDFAITSMKKQNSLHRFSVSEILSPFDSIGS